MEDSFLRPSVRAYLDAVVQECARREPPLVSLVLFGSAATGAFTQEVSDVDLLLVVADDATPEQRRRLSEMLARLEVLHGLRAPRSRPATRLEAFLDRAAGNAPGGFICSRSDLLSGEAARVFVLRRVEALLVDRIVLATIIRSALTWWGEDLLPRVPLRPVRRIDVLKAFVGFCGQALLCAAAYPLLPEATRYTMGALKRSLHSCYFCYHGTIATLEEEVAFFRQHRGVSGTLEQLLDLRRHYRRSLLFVLRCVPVLARLHWRAACDNDFPIRLVRREEASPANTRRGTPHATLTSSSDPCPSDWPTA